MKAKFYPDTSPFEHKKNYNESWNWKCSKQGINELRKHVIWNMNSGENINIWEDRWLPSDNFEPLKKYREQAGSHSRIEKVKDLITENGEWNTRLLTTIFPNHIALKISSMIITDNPDSVNVSLSKITTKNIY